MTASACAGSSQPSGHRANGSGPHLNAFPLKMVPIARAMASRSGIPIRRLRPHAPPPARRSGKPLGPARSPNLAGFFNDRDGDKEADGGSASKLEDFIDATEIYGDSILTGKPMVDYPQGKSVRRENRVFAWLQMLNAGRRVWTVAVSDAQPGDAGRRRRLAELPAEQPRSPR